jgi:hypothetical protein
VLADAVETLDALPIVESVTACLRFVEPSLAEVHPIVSANGRTIRYRDVAYVVILSRGEVNDSLA